MGRDIQVFRKIMTPRQHKFASLLASGERVTDAYRKVYKRKVSDQSAAERGCTMAKHPAVVAEVARIRAKSEGMTLLTLNQRLDILAKLANTKGKLTPAMMNAKARCVEVYSKISGDQAPERHEVTGRDGQPFKTELNAIVTVTTKRDKIAAILAKPIAQT